MTPIRVRMVYRNDIVVGSIDMTCRHITCIDIRYDTRRVHFIKIERVSSLWTRDNRAVWYLRHQLGMEGNAESEVCECSSQVSPFPTPPSITSIHLLKQSSFESRNTVNAFLLPDRY
ncbi:hypothetical protein J6590_005563 [Homalodisca vitripennis]|nr:hypothetical protein J6590_005563 [Homalodisca vitripennis]